jgi:hypothetical protein
VTEESRESFEFDLEVEKIEVFEGSGFYTFGFFWIFFFEDEI